MGWEEAATHLEFGQRLLEAIVQAQVLLEAPVAGSRHCSGGKAEGASAPLGPFGLGLKRERVQIGSRLPPGHATSGVGARGQRVSGLRWL